MIDLPTEVVKLLELQTEALEAYDILRTTFTVNPDIYFTPYSRFKHAFTPKTN